MKTLLLVSAFCLWVVGCGPELPSTPMGDASPNADTVMTADVPASDRDTSSTNDAGAPTDHVTPVEAGTDAGSEMICIPSSLDGTHTRTCEGAALCQPARANPTCAGAMACDCNLQPSDMPAALCTAETMPSCTAAVSCSPGRNHCSIHLPTNVDYVPFPAAMLNPTPLGRGGLIRTLSTDEGWREIRSSMGDHLYSYLQPLYSNRGFVQICSRLPNDVNEIPPEMRGMFFCAECSGATCYWNRGALRRNAPSAEFTISDDACIIQFRLYIGGNAEPLYSLTDLSLSTLCN